MNSRSFHAAEFSAESIAKHTDKCLYMWTFTFKWYMGPEEVGHAWKLIRQAAARIGLTEGFRVYEWHPGGHGLHIHVLTRCRVSSREMWEVVGHKWGRVDVTRVHEDRAKYVVKYLLKGSRRAPGLRMWATFGKSAAEWRGRGRDVVLDSPFGEFCKAALTTFQEERAKQCDLRVYDAPARERFGVLLWAREMWSGATRPRTPCAGAFAPYSLVTIRNKCTAHLSSWPAWLVHVGESWDALMFECGLGAF